jgi:hypothetical protein
MAVGSEAGDPVGPFDEKNVEDKKSHDTFSSIKMIEYDLMNISLFLAVRIGT